MAAHAVGAQARPARPLAARRRDRGHRPWSRARGALERPDRGRAHLLRRAAFAAGRDHRAPARAPRPSQPARRAAARRAGIRDRRHDLAVQGGDRRRLQGGRGAAPRRHPSALRPAGGAAGGAHRADQGRGPFRRLSRGDAASPDFPPPRRAGSSARRPSSPPRSSATTSRPGRRRSPNGAISNASPSSPAADADTGGRQCATERVLRALPSELTAFWQKCNMGSFPQNQTEMQPTLSRQDSSPYKGATAASGIRCGFGTIP